MKVEGLIEKTEKVEEDMRVMRSEIGKKLKDLDNNMEEVKNLLKKSKDAK